MRIDTSAATLTAARRTAPAPRSASAAPAEPGTSASGSTAGGATSAGEVDFTRMTRQGLLDWMNTRIRSGELSLDDSSGLLGMTLKMPVAGGGAAIDDREPVDFVQKAQDGLRWARDQHQDAQARVLENALAVMRQHQGESLRVDLVA